jgi:hypothetical protein
MDTGNWLASANCAKCAQGLAPATAQHCPPTGPLDRGAVAQLYHAVCAPPGAVALWPGAACVECRGDLAGPSRVLCSACARRWWVDWVDRVTHATGPVAVPKGALALSPPLPDMYVATPGARLFREWAAADVLDAGQPMPAFLRCEGQGDWPSTATLVHRGAAAVGWLRRYPRGASLSQADAARADPVYNDADAWQCDRAYLEAHVPVGPAPAPARTGAAAARNAERPVIRPLATLAAVEPKLLLHAGLVCVDTARSVAGPLCYVVDHPVPFDPAWRRVVVGRDAAWLDYARAQHARPWTAVPTADTVRHLALSLAHLPALPSVGQTQRLVPPSAIAELVSSCVLVPYATGMYRLNVPLLLLRSGWAPGYHRPLPPAPSSELATSRAQQLFAAQRTGQAGHAMRLSSYFQPFPPQSPLTPVPLPVP